MHKIMITYLDVESWDKETGHDDYLEIEINYSLLNSKVVSV